MQQGMFGLGSSVVPELSPLDFEFSSLSSQWEDWLQQTRMVRSYGRKPVPFNAHVPNPRSSP